MDPIFHRPESRFFKELRDDFEISSKKIPIIVEHFHNSMEQGLSEQKGVFKMLPSFLSRPEGTEKGRYLVLDLGGTNIRVLEVVLRGGGEVSLIAASRFVIPGRVMNGPGEELFDFIAECVDMFFMEHKRDKAQDYPLAFTFSFPVEQHSIASGILLKWTKGFTAYNVVGRDVVVMMNDALRRRSLERVRVAALLNDTVATLMAGAYADPSCDMGVIIGTGTNACYPERHNRIKKLKNLGATGEMIINMEWGNFDGFERNRFDLMLDQISLNPGEQQMEKMVSAMYLGEIARLVIIDMIDKGLLSRSIMKVLEHPFSLDAKQVVQIAEGLFSGVEGLLSVKDPERRALSSICEMVIKRSARIAAISVYSVLTWIDPPLQINHTIAVDGALFENNPFYRAEMERTFYELCGKKKGPIKMALFKDGSGIGSAVACAVSERGKK
ncbi:MAG: hypothetical protein N2745_07265 [Syntrophorhabdaceae bacterium]|nr:hypothetical protein [Syntrophorhabdaceae bacterium]